jgi:hypothetical protein
MTIKNLYPNIEPTLNLSFALTKALDPRITFSRASSGAVYDGKTVAKAEENLFQRSQEFNSTPTWSVPLRASIAADATTAPDGTSTADTLIEDSTTNSHYVPYATTTWPTSTYTLSVFAKLASGSRRLSLNQSFGGVVGYAIFDLSAGTVAATSGAHTASIVNAGNGWYRCIVTYTTTSTTARFDFALNAGGAAGLESYAGDGTSGIHLWGAQLEQRSAVTAYTPTTTQPITNYVPVLLSAANNVARFDHNPVTGESLGLLIEEQRTNLLTRSEEFNDSAWVKTASSITANTVVAPDGTLTGDKLVEDTTNASHLITRSVSVTSGTTYTYSLFAKAAERSIIRIATGLAFPSAAVTVSLSDGSVSDGTAVVQQVGNGWLRISLTVTASSTGSAEIYTASRITTGGGSSAYTGDGFSGIYIWGAQLEAGAFPTSYIPTVASQVTRSADAASMTGANFSSWYRADSGTVLVDGWQLRGSTNFNNPVFYITDGTENNYIRQLGSFRIASVNVNGVSQFSNDFGAPSLTTQYKSSLAYKVNDFAACFGGGAVATDSSGVLPVVDRLLIGRRVSGDGVINGTIKKLAFYPERLSNAELQALTQI